MSELRAFACCTGGPHAGGRHVFMIPAADELRAEGVGEEIGSGYQMPARRRHEAIHESAHACVAIALGATVTSAEIEPQLVVHHRGDLSRASRVVIALAAEAAMAWDADSRIERMSSDDVAAYLGAIRSGCGGPCDACRAFRHLTRSGVEDDREIIAAFRTLENVAGTIVRLPMLWSAIVALADELLERGSLNGDRVHEIAERHFRRGFVMENMEA